MLLLSGKKGLHKLHQPSCFAVAWVCFETHLLSFLATPLAYHIIPAKGEDLWGLKISLAYNYVQLFEKTNAYLIYLEPLCVLKEFSFF